MLLICLPSLLGYALAAQLTAKQQNTPIFDQLPEPSWINLTENDAQRVVAHHFGWEDGYFKKFPTISEDFGKKFNDLRDRLGEDILNTMKPEACGVFLRVFNLFRIIPKVSEACAAHFIKNITVFSMMTLLHIPVEWAKVAPSDLVKAVTGLNENSFIPLQPETLAYLLSNPDNACTHLTWRHLNSIGPKSYSLITPECMAAISDLQNAKIPNTFLGECRDDLFSSYDFKLNPETVKNMKPAQVASFGSALSKDIVCTEIDFFEFLNWEHYISVQCLIGSIASLHYKIDPKKFWPKIPENLVVKLVERIHLVIPLITANHIPHLPLALREAAIYDPRMIGNFHERYNRSNISSSLLDSISLSSRKFSSLLLLDERDLLNWLLNLSAIPEDLLGFCSTDQVFDFIKRPSILQILALKNKRVIFNIKPKVCSLMTEEWYGSISALPYRRYGSPECKQALPFANAPNYCEKFPEIASPEHYINKPSEWWGKIGAILFIETLSKDSEGWISKKVDCIEFMSVPNRKMIDSNLIKHFAPYVSRSIAPDLLDNVFENIDHDTFSNFGRNTKWPLRLQDLSFNQALKLSANVQKGNGVFENAKIEDITELLRKYPNINIPADMWKGLGTNLEKLPEDCLKQTSPEGVFASREFITPEMVPKLSNHAFCRFNSADLEKFSFESYRPEQILTLIDSGIWDFNVFPCRENAIAWADFIGPILPEWQLEALEERFEGIRSEIALSWGNIAKKSRKMDAALFLMLTRGLDKMIATGGPSREKADTWIDSFLDGLDPNVISELYSNPVLAKLKSPSNLALAESKAARSLLVIEINRNPSPLPIKSNGVSFVLGPVYDFIIRSPMTMLDRSLELENDEMIDKEGIMRGLINQMLNEFKDQFTTGISGSEARKPKWLLSRKVFCVFGILLGKAAQLEIRLPFTLDPEVYHFMVNPSDEQISIYYKERYKKKISDYKSKGLFRFAGKDEYDRLNSNPSDAQKVIDPLKLTFTTFDKKSNLRIFNEEEEGISLSDYSFDTAETVYFDELVGPRIFAEFSKGIMLMSTAFKLGLDSEHLKIMSPHWIKKILGGIFDDQEFIAKDIISQISWEGLENSVAVPSLFREKEISPRQIVESFMLALNQKELHRLMQSWTGSATFSPGKSKTFRVQFSDPGSTTLELEKGFLQKAELGERSPWVMISAGDEYVDILRRIATQQSVMLGCSMDSFDLEFLCADHEASTFINKISTCDTELQIVRQSTAARMVQSLVEYLNIPDGQFYDK